MTDVEEDPSLTFDELHRVSTRMVTADVVNRQFRRQEQLAACEMTKEENFQRKLRQASALLKQAEGRPSCPLTSAHLISIALQGPL